MSFGESSTSWFYSFTPCFRLDSQGMVILTQVQITDLGKGPQDLQEEGLEELVEVEVVHHTIPGLQWVVDEEGRCLVFWHISW
mmetsp:Transcript_1978/g.3426  ORF Transcript_1978/g.3426 Transcript_1978/m.3426 type:complete len:83 (-) Transcript_1978:175-423(-)